MNARGYPPHMTERLDDMPLPDADRYAAQRIEDARHQMHVWRRKRGKRLAAEVAAGRTVPEIAAELGLDVSGLYRLIREATD